MNLLHLGSYLLFNKRPTYKQTFDLFGNGYSNIRIFFLLQIDLRTSGQTVTLTSPR